LIVANVKSFSARQISDTHFFFSSDASAACVPSISPFLFPHLAICTLTACGVLLAPYHGAQLAIPSLEPFSMEIYFFDL